MTHFHLTRKLTSEKLLGFSVLLSKETLEELIKINHFQHLPFWPGLCTPRQRLHGQSSLWSCIRRFQWYPCLVDSLFFQNVFFIINLLFQGGFVLFTVNFGFRGVRMYVSGRLEGWVVVRFTDFLQSWPSLLDPKVLTGVWHKKLRLKAFLRAF